MQYMSKLHLPCQQNVMYLEKNHTYDPDVHDGDADAVMEIEAEPGDLMAGRPPDK